MPSSKLTSQSNLTKCNNPAVNNESTWVPTLEKIDKLVFQLKAKEGGDTEANWETIILNFKKELDIDINMEDGRGEGGGLKMKLKPPELTCGGEVKIRAKFSVPLSRREMEKDFEDMGERRLPRKPKKRPKSIQNKLDTLFPGLWLTEINADLYRVSDTKKLR